jgi:hypothetical protein
MLVTEVDDAEKPVDADLFDCEVGKETRSM